MPCVKSSTSTQTRNACTRSRSASRSTRCSQTTRSAECARRWRYPLQILEGSRPTLVLERGRPARGTVTEARRAWNDVDFKMVDESELPASLIERAKMMEGILIASATGGSNDTHIYEHLRRE